MTDIPRTTIDRPLAVRRIEWDAQWPAPLAIAPHAGWNGRYDLGTFDDEREHPCSNSAGAHHLSPHDRMGRDTLTVRWGRRDSLTVRQRYDAEGELLAVTQHAYPDTNHLGDVTRSFTYDAIGRKLTESLAGTLIVAWTYDPAGNLLTGGRTALQGATLRYDALNRLVARSGAVHDTLTYDAAGHLATATNPWARTARTYYPNGLVKTDTQEIATTDTTTPPDFSQHIYVLGYSYDVGGRRTALTLPTQLGGGQTTYGYDPRTGQLALVTDRLGLHVRSHYDAMGRLDSLIRRDGLSDPVTETRTYDLASRLKARVVWTAAGAVLERDTLAYNLVGKVVGTSMGDGVSYHPLGYVTESTFAGKTEYATLDAMANRATAHTQIVHGFQDRVEQYDPGTMKLRVEWDPYKNAPDADTTKYDVDDLGAVYHSLRQLSMGPWTDPSTHLQWPQLTLRWDIVNAYDDANRMIRHQLSYDSLPNPREHPPYLATETYRYDALGRRVWVRSVKDSLCYYAEKASGCHNTLTRTVWDGTQILGEIRADGRVVATPAEIESDNPSVGANYGVVLYTYGGGALDEPWSVIKGTSDEVLPITNWRGMIDRGTCPATPCVGLVFPQSTAGLYGGPALADGPPSWYGTILDGQQDASGYIYKRNRYLDPATGRFTQEDPIGLAGGLNVYGFAGGDPVNFSDPFGLFACCDIGIYPQATVVLPVAGGVAGSVLGPVGWVIVGIGVLDLLQPNESSAGGSTPSVVAQTDATAYTPGGRFSDRTKRQIDKEATEATGKAGTCEYCSLGLVPAAGSPNSVEMDHQKSRKRGGDNSPGNGRRSCRKCNRKFGSEPKPDPRAPEQPPQPQS